MLIDDILQPLQRFESRLGVVCLVTFKTLHLGDPVRIQQMCLVGDTSQPHLSFYERYGLRKIGLHSHAYIVRSILVPSGSRL